MVKSKNERIVQSVDWQSIDNSYIEVYMNHFVKQFRHYNNDEFLIVVSGLTRFIRKEDKVLMYLLERLKGNKFTIEFVDSVERITHIDVACTNTTQNMSDKFIYQIQNLPTIIELSSKTDRSAVEIIIMKIVAQIITKSKILYKAIVLDLDDTLWLGTLSESGIDRIKENLQSEQGAPFIAFMKFVKTLANELGIFIAICSRNDSKIVESTLKELDDTIFPLKNQIDCIIANNNDKSENIRKVAEQLSILPESIVFIDDNQIVRDEVKHNLPKIFVPEWSNHTELVTQLIIGCMFERVELSINSQNRRKQRTIIEDEKKKNCLPALSIEVINDDKHTESIKLYSKSNQFKFSQYDDKFGGDAKSLYFEIYRENGESLGICSAITYTHSDNTFLIHNWAISCRFFEIGLEQFILMHIHKIANVNKIFIKYQRSEHNQKVSELLEKYSDTFKNNDNNDTVEIFFTKDITDIINKNTNLKYRKNG